MKCALVSNSPLLIGLLATLNATISKFGENNVTYVRNITDIDDKIIAASLEKKISTQELTEKITKSFHEDCEYLVCEKPSQEPKATENISQMIEMINKLMKNGFAYLNKQHVYFEVKKFKDYGKLSNKNLDDLIAGSRVEVSENNDSGIRLINTILKSKIFQDS